MHYSAKGVVSIISVVLLTTFVLAAVLVVTLIAKAGIVNKIKHADSIKALFLAESALENASWLYANDTECEDLAGMNTVFGAGSFQVIQAAFIVNCELQVVGRVGDTTRVIEAELALTTGGEAWAVGKKGTILHRVNGVWSVVASGTDKELEAISCAAQNVCWAGGKDGTLLQWNGVVWTSITLNSNEDYKGISCAPDNPNFCMIVGKDGSGIARLWTGSWSGVFSFNEEMAAIDCIAGQCITVGKSGVGWSYQSGSWVEENLATSEDMAGVSCLAGGECWAVGKKQQNKFTLAYRDSGSGWTELAVPSNAKQDLNGVDCISSNVCWAVGKNGRILRKDVIGWAYLGAITNQELNDVMCSSENGMCLTVGKNGTVLFWDGSNWIQEIVPISESLESVYLFGGGTQSVNLLSWREVFY